MKSPSYCFRHRLIAALLSPVSLSAQDALRVNASTTVNPVVTEAAEIKKRSRV